MFYQEHPYFTGDKIKILKPLFDGFSRKNAHFFIVAMSLAFRAFSWGSSSFSEKVIAEQKVSLPTKDGRIDFAFMESFIAEIEAQRLTELDAYLTAAGLKDTELTAEEQTALQQLKTTTWGTYKLGDLFSVNTSKKRFDANKVEILSAGEYPYVVRTSLNNGQRGFLNESPEFLNEGNTIAFGQDTATMFYQEHPYFTGDKIKILKPLFDGFSRKNAHFFIVAMSLAFRAFSWGSSSFSEKIIAEQSVLLPTDTKGKPDYDLMQRLISAVQKLVIRDVVAHADAQITATRSAISNVTQ